MLSFKLKKTERRAEQLEQEKADQEKKLLEVNWFMGQNFSNILSPNFKILIYKGFKEILIQHLLLYKNYLVQH